MRRLFFNEVFSTYISQDPGRKQMATAIQVIENLIEILCREVNAVKERQQGLGIPLATSSNRWPLPLLGLKSDGRDNVKEQESCREDFPIETLDLDETQSLFIAARQIGS